MSSPEKLSSVLSTYLSSRGYLSSCREYDVINHWKDIVGDSVASVSFCEGVENGVLYVKVKTSSWRQELSFVKNEILHKIVIKTDCKSIKEIVFV